ncbi:MAG: NAD-dependent DNA ligase LigA [Deltaproteobacteria bacterium]|nr:NAD-dependent DNA ligase LigA [Deltaproteobacteria bacterium]
MKSLSEQLIHSLGIDDLEKEIRHHNDLYFKKNAPEISDYDFDRLVERLKSLSPQSPLLKELGSDLRKAVSVPKITHLESMLSLDKCYDLEGLMDWAVKFEGDVVAMPKIDGCAISIRYGSDGTIEVASTRGDGQKGEDITANVQFVQDIPQKISFKNIEVRGEIYMPLSIFKEYQETFSNPRNLAAGAIKQKSPRKTGEYRLSFFAYDVRQREFLEEIEKSHFLNELGFKAVDSSLLLKDRVILQKEYDRYLSIRHQVDYELDGVVFKTNSVSEQKRLGASSHHPRFAIAYKFQGDSGTTLLRQVEWSVARTGAITPIGIVDPVELSGAQVSRVSLHNVGMFQKMGVTLPCEVLMMRRGGVIPHLEQVLKREGKPVAIPEKCPSCGALTEIRDDFLYCSNGNNCRKATLGSLEHFLKTLEIDGFGEVLIEKLHDSGLVEDPADFYALTEEQLLSLDRMGDVLAKKLIKNVQNKRQISFDVFLQSLGIRELAKHASKIFMKAFQTLDRLQQASEEDLAQLHGIGPVTAHEVVKGLKEKKILIDKLLQQMSLLEEKDGSALALPFSGKRFLFTGKMSHLERSEAEKKVEEWGGEIASSVTQGLHFLVLGSEGYKNREKGNKLIKAEQLIEKGAPLKIISEEDFLEMISEHGDRDGQK